MAWRYHGVVRAPLNVPLNVPLRFADYAPLTFQLPARTTRRASPAWTWLVRLPRPARHLPRAP
ncbi:hypothetical protein CBM2605_A100003 [Cupriavidus neocaledonicus]|uniref:Uncharacterized protein n=1 Tax=Cupriavidus neocaledonicus TaxID=1040979 RepID=A0ABY1UVV0_9BURK|nr:hypothetical protein CBM2605_A100003 [Cupriavidus neocaledonicus]